MAAFTSTIKGGDASSKCSSGNDGGGVVAAVDDDSSLARSSAKYSLHLLRTSSSFTSRFPLVSLQMLVGGV